MTCNVKQGQIKAFVHIRGERPRKKKKIHEMMDLTLFMPVCRMCDGKPFRLTARTGGIHNHQNTYWHIIRFAGKVSVTEIFLSPTQMRDGHPSWV